MDWDAVIEVISDTVKEDNVRSEIYKRLFEIVGTSDAVESLEQDNVFDEALWAYTRDEDEEDEIEQDYDYESEEYDYDD